MTKPEILEVVKQMLVDWQNAQKLDTRSEVFDTNCYKGFCYWLRLRNGYNLIIEELVKDFSISNNPSEFYWYGTVSSSIRNFKEILQIRIDHLNRTIARLENEISNEKSN